MKRIILNLVLIILTGYIIVIASDSIAASSTTEGENFKTVNCSGHGKGWPDCYRQAENLCPDGYTVIEKSTGVVSAPVNGQYILVPAKKMVVLCK